MGLNGKFLIYLSDKNCGLLKRNLNICMLRKKEKGIFHEFNWVRAYSYCTVFSMSKSLHFLSLTHFSPVSHFYTPWFMEMKSEYSVLPYGSTGLMNSIFTISFFSSKWKYMRWKYFGFILFKMSFCGYIFRSKRCSKRYLDRNFVSTKN